MHKTTTKKDGSNELSVLFAMLGFLSGLPLSLFTSTLVMWLNNTELNTTIVINTSLLTIPYVMKPFTAAIMDFLRSKKIIKDYMVLLIAALGTAIALFYASRFDPLGQTRQFMLVMLCGCFFSSVMDIVVDAARIVMVPEPKRGIVTAYFLTAYRIAMLFTGAAVVYVHGELHIAYNLLYALSAAVILILGIITTSVMGFYNSIDEDEEHTVQPILSVKELLIWLGQKEILYLLMFTVLFRAHEALVGTNLPLYIVTLGYKQSDCALIVKTVGFFATIVGGYMAGFCLKNWSEEFFIQSIMLLQICASTALICANYIGFNASISVYLPCSTLTDLCTVNIGVNNLITIGATIFEQFATGLAGTLTVVLIMRICDKEYAATQFSVFTSLIMLTRALVGPIANLILPIGGWDLYFTLSIMFIALTSLSMQTEAIRNILEENRLST